VTPHFPAMPGPAPQLGVGFDLSWGNGFVAHPAGDHAHPAVKRFLADHHDRFAHVFVSWQPRSRGAHTLDLYRPAWDDLFANLQGYPVRALHQTALNLAGARYDRDAILDLTNALVARYGLRWVNEDLGYWSLDGRPLPYPLPPPLTDAGLDLVVANTVACREALCVPLVVEFPGFSDAYSLVIGDWDAYDFFREAVQRANVPCTLDVGHLLSWRWLRGHRGPALLEGLERLPLAHCFEVHLSGVQLDGERFVDAHHGVLIPAQHALLDRLRALCPNLRAVTYEDPRFDTAGQLAASNQSSLRTLIEQMATPVAPETLPAPRPRPTSTSADIDPFDLECALDRCLRDPAHHATLTAPHPLADLHAADVATLGLEVRGSLARRPSLGQPSLHERFAPLFEAWRIAHPSDPNGLLAAFGAHPAGSRWSDDDPARPCLEQALFDFALELHLIDPEVLRQCFYTSLFHTLAIDPTPRFRVPEWVEGGPGDYRFVDPGPPCRLYAVAGTRVICGPLPALAADVLAGHTDDAIEARHGLQPGGVRPVRAKLEAIGLHTQPAS